VGEYVDGSTWVCESVCGACGVQYVVFICGTSCIHMCCMTHVFDMRLFVDVCVCTLCVCLLFGYEISL